MELLETLAGKLVALAAGLAATAWLVRGGWRTFKKIDKIWAALQFVEKEMKPNGGKSLRDTVDRLETSLASHLNEHAKAPVQVNVAVPPPSSPAQQSGGS